MARSTVVKRLAWIGVVVALSAALAAYAGAAPRAGQGPQRARSVVTAKAFLAKFGTGKNLSPLPTSAPTPKKNMSIWFISCGQALSGCAWGANGTSAAVDLLKKYGWTYTLFDTKEDPSLYPTGIEQATVAKANAIILGAVDCGSIKPQLDAARAAGIIVIGLESFDCGDPTQGGTSNVFTHTTDQGPYRSLAKNVGLWGKLQAAWAVVHTKGDAKVIQFTNNQNATTTYVGRGFDEYLTQNCSTCQILGKAPFLLPDLVGPPMEQKASAAILQYPSANIIESPYDPAAAPIATALTQSGKTGIASIATLGVPQASTLIKTGRGQTMDVGVDLNWAAYAAVDDIIRISAGKAPVNGGVGLGILDRANAKAGQFYKAPVDYAANYKKIWGVS